VTTTVCFLQNTKLLKVEPKYKFITEKHIVTLLIYEVKKEDEGTYEVVVSNPAGISRCSATLTLKKPAQPRPPSPPSETAPELIEPLTAQTVDEGKSVTLSCSIKGQPGRSPAEYRYCE